MQLIRIRRRDILRPNAENVDWPEGRKILSISPCRHLVTFGLLLSCLPAANAQQQGILAWHATTSAGFLLPAEFLQNAYDSSISGTVLDVQGALVAGAQVKLSYASGAAGKETTSGSDGRFQFQDVAPGAFTISVALQGFDPASTTGSLQPGQGLETTPFTLRVATAVVEVDAVVAPSELAEEQIHVQEKQRLIGILPNFFVSYQWKTPPLTSKQKFSLAWKNARDPGNLLLVGTLAGIQQASNDFSGYGQGAQGYGKRYGADLANLVVGTMMGGAVLPSLFHQDPRYFYKGTGSVRSRALYAISTAVISRGDNGHRQPAYASVLGDLSAGAISNIYYPASDRHGAALTFENGLLGVAGDALNNLFQEFVLRRMTPKAAKRDPNKP